MYPHDDVKVYLHEKDCDHNDLPFETSCGLTDQLKAIINECVERGQAKPKQIIAEMRRSGISGTNEPENLRQKISTYVAYQKKKRYGESGVTVADLYQFCTDNEKDPQLEDQCYVIGYEFPEDIGLDGVSKFRILLSSKRLLDHTPSTICYKFMLTQHINCFGKAILYLLSDLLIKGMCSIPLPLGFVAMKMLMILSLFLIHYEILVIIRNI